MPCVVSGPTILAALPEVPADRDVVEALHVARGAVEVQEDQATPLTAPAGAMPTTGGVWVQPVAVSVIG